MPIDEDPGDWPQLSIALDSGAVGRAAASFAKNKLGYTLRHALWQTPPQPYRIFTVAQPLGMASIGEVIPAPWRHCLQGKGVYPHHRILN